MNFEYEIKVDVYVAGQLLYNAKMRGGKRFIYAFCWFLVATLFLFVAWKDESPGFAPLLLLLMAVYWIYAAIVTVFPAHYLRSYYKKTQLKGKKFKVEMNEHGFESTDDLCSWRVQWPAIRLKGENERAFMFHATTEVFIFGKRYLNDEQQNEVRRLSGLKN